MFRSEVAPSGPRLLEESSDLPTSTCSTSFGWRHLTTVTGPNSDCSARAQLQNRRGSRGRPRCPFRHSPTYARKCTASRCVDAGAVPQNRCLPDKRGNRSRPRRNRERCCGGNCRDAYQCHNRRSRTIRTHSRQSPRGSHDQPKRRCPQRPTSVRRCRALRSVDERSAPARASRWSRTAGRNRRKRNKIDRNKD
jgi:hypothetical protein